MSSPTPVYDRARRDAELGALLRTLPGGAGVMRGPDGQWYGLIRFTSHGPGAQTAAYGTPEAALRAALALRLDK